MDLQNATRYLIQLSDGGRLASAEIKQFIKTRYLKAESLTGHGDMHNIIPEEEITVLPHKLAAAVQTPGNALREHYSLLFKLVVYVEYVRKHGAIGREGPVDSLKSRFKELEMKIYNILCDVLLALKGIDHDTTTIQTTFDLPKSFTDAETSFANETMRAYVVIKDSELVMKYLLEMHTAIYRDLMEKSVNST